MIRKNICFDNNIVEYIKSYQKENEISTFKQALELIILEHKEKDKIKLEDAVVKKIELKFSKMFTRLRLGTTAADINVQILLECMNALAKQYEIKPMPTTVLESELIADSRRVVKERIEHFKQQHDWKESKKKETN